MALAFEKPYLPAPKSDKSVTCRYGTLPVNKADNNKQFRVLFRGKVANKFTREQATATLAKMLKAQPGSLAPIFAGEQKISFSKKPLDFHTAVKLKVKLLRMGLVTEIEPWHKDERTPASQQQQTQTAATKTPSEKKPAPSSQASAETAAPAPQQAPAEQPAGSAEANSETVAAASDETDTSGVTPTQTMVKQAAEQNTQPVTAPPEPPPDNANEEAPEVIRLDEAPQYAEVIEHLKEIPDEEEATTSETVFHEQPDFRPWWRRLFTLPSTLLALLIAGLLGYWIYQLTVFTPPSAAVVIENHLATEDLGLIGLIDVEKLRTTARWIDVGGNDITPSPEMQLLRELGIDQSDAIDAIVFAQHIRNGRQPTTIVLLGEFDEAALRSTLQTRYDAHDDPQQRHRLLFTVADDTGCERDLAVQLDHNEIILSSADFIDDAYHMIHESFDSKPSMLKSWREFRRYHPASFAVYDPAAISPSARAILSDILGGADPAAFDSILLGIDTGRVLIGDALISVVINASNQESLETLAATLTASAPFSGMTPPQPSAGTITFQAPLSARNINRPALAKNSLLEICH